MSFKEAIQSVFSKYATFSGRARRSEYWYWSLFTSLVSGALSILAQATGKNGDPNVLFTGISSLFSLAVLVPGLAVIWRRLHDTGRSGGWYFIGLIPIVGWILLIVWCCQDSQPGDNQYGPNPKQPVYTYYK